MTPKLSDIPKIDILMLLLFTWLAWIFVDKGKYILAALLMYGVCKAGYDLYRKHMFPDEVPLLPSSGTYKLFFIAICAGVWMLQHTEQEAFAAMLAGAYAILATWLAYKECRDHKVT